MRSVFEWYCGGTTKTAGLRQCELWLMAYKDCEHTPLLIVVGCSACRQQRHHGKNIMNNLWTAFVFGLGKCSGCVDVSHTGRA